MIIKYGKDPDLEAQADELLRGSAGENPRGLDRDWEKMAYESGYLSFEELEFYDPANDWDTLDSSYAIMVDPGDVDHIEPSVCDIDDGNIRGQHPQLYERKKLMRAVDDREDWGTDEEEIPFLGDNGDRKVCAKCKRSKRLDCFSPRNDRQSGLQSWCKKCRKDAGSQKRQRKREQSHTKPL